MEPIFLTWKPASWTLLAEVYIHSFKFHSLRFLTSPSKIVYYYMKIQRCFLSVFHFVPLLYFFVCYIKNVRNLQEFWYHFSSSTYPEIGKSAISPLHHLYSDLSPVQLAKIEIHKNRIPWEFKKFRSLHDYVLFIMIWRFFDL